MKYENPVSYNLKLTTLESLHRLLTEGKHLTLKSACYSVFSVCKRCKTSTGFKASTPEKFYDSVRTFQKRLKQNVTEIHTQKTSLSAFDEALET